MLHIDENWYTKKWHYHTHVNPVMDGEASVKLLRLGDAYTYHYGDVIMGAIASQITSLTIVYSTIYSDTDQRKHQSSTSLAFVQGIHQGPVNSPHKWPVTRKMFPFDDIIMTKQSTQSLLVLGNGLVLVWYKIITSINDEFMSTGTSRTNQSEILFEVWKSS